MSSHPAVLAIRCLWKILQHWDGPRCFSSLSQQPVHQRPGLWLAGADSGPVPAAKACYIIDYNWMYLEWQHGDSSRAFRRSWSSQACLEMKALHESVHWILQKIWKKAWSTRRSCSMTAQLHYLDPFTIVNYTRTLVEICFVARLNGHASLVFLVNTVRFSSSTWEPQWPLIMLRRRIFSSALNIYNHLHPQE